jgi:serine phosphatase RsbU (regulator of sigma subunit)
VNYRVIAMIGEHLAEPPEKILEALVQDIEAFTGGAPPEDGRTAIIIKRNFA